MRCTRAIIARIPELSLLLLCIIIKNITYANCYYRRRRRHLAFCIFFCFFFFIYRKKGLFILFNLFIFVFVDNFTRPWKSCVCVSVLSRKLKIGRKQIGQSMNCLRVRRDAEPFSRNFQASATSMSDERRATRTGKNSVRRSASSCV